MLLADRFPRGSTPSHLTVCWTDRYVTCPSSCFPKFLPQAWWDHGNALFKLYHVLVVRSDSITLIIKGLFIKGHPFIKGQ